MIGRKNAGYYREITLLDQQMGRLRRELPTLMAMAGVELVAPHPLDGIDASDISAGPLFWPARVTRAHQALRKSNCLLCSTMSRPRNPQ